MFGDLGDTANSSTVRDHLLAANPDFILNTGDFTYAGESLEPLGDIRCIKLLGRVCPWKARYPLTVRSHRMAWQGALRKLRSLPARPFVISLRLLHSKRVHMGYVLSGNLWLRWLRWFWLSCVFDRR